MQIAYKLKHTNVNTATTHPKFARKQFTTSLKKRFENERAARSISLLSGNESLRVSEIVSPLAQLKKVDELWQVAISILGNSTNFILPA